MYKEKVLSTVKDVHLIKKRRKQMIKASIALFKEKGFHETTTREIAKQSGFSIGTLYEYIRTKEDILFLVCDSIYEQVQSRLIESLSIEEPSVEKLRSFIGAYFHMMDEMQEEVLILYQEVKSLKKESRNYVLQMERDMVNMLKNVIKKSIRTEIPEKDIYLIANNIFVKGQMWCFRRWALQKEYTLEDYIERQTKFLVDNVTDKEV